MSNRRAGTKRIKTKRIEVEWRKLSKIEIPQTNWCDYINLSPSDPRQRAWKYIFLFGSGHVPPPTTGEKLIMDEEIQNSSTWTKKWTAQALP